MVLEQKKEKLKELLVFICETCQADYSCDNGFYHLEIITSSGIKEHDVNFCSADCLVLWLKKVKNPFLVKIVMED